MKDETRKRLEVADRLAIAWAHPVVMHGGGYA